MMPQVYAILVTIVLCVVGVVGDYFLKIASEASNPLATRHFYIGFLVYSSTAFGWVFVMQHLKLAYIGVFYSLSFVLLLALTGWIFFKETLRPMEMVGVGMAICSLLLLSRIAAE